MLTLTDEQRNELRTWAASRTLPAGDVFRARLILALSDGQSYSQIKTTLQTTAPTISRWKQRFEEAGMASIPVTKAVSRVWPMRKCRLESRERRSRNPPMVPPTGRAAKWRRRLG